MTKLDFVLIAAIGLASAILSPASTARAQLPAQERFDGSFRLDDGSTITGGMFVEGDSRIWIYLDTENTAVGSAFIKAGDGPVFRSIAPPGTAASRSIELEFLAGPDGSYDRLVWREDGKSVEGKRVFAHSSRDIVFPAADGTILKGRLIEPLCRAPRPAIVAVHGSGPATRHGGPFDLFFVRQGISVLSYDKRGAVPGSKWSEPDIDTLAKDVAAAAHFLSRQPGIDRDKIGLAGSSQAGWTAPIAASLGRGVDFLILRAGAATTQHDSFVHEKRQEWRAQGLSGLDLDNAVALLDEVLTLAEQGKDIGDADRVASAYIGSDWYERAFGKGKLSENWSERWWGYVGRNMAATSLPAIERSRLPKLWFLADRDEAVPFVATRAALEQAFEKSPATDETIVTVPGAAHNFIVQKDGAPVFAPGYFSTMASWLKARGYSKPGCQSD